MLTTHGLRSDFIHFPDFIIKSFHLRVSRNYFPSGAGRFTGLYNSRNREFVSVLRSRTYPVIGHIIIGSIVYITSDTIIQEERQIPVFILKLIVQTSKHFRFSVSDFMREDRKR